MTKDSFVVLKMIKEFHYVKYAHKQTPGCKTPLESYLTMESKVLFHGVYGRESEGIKKKIKNQT